MSRRPETHAYGAHPDQYLELYRPPTPLADATVVIVHGGFWRARYDLSLGRPLADDLRERGYVAVNLEYRRVGRGGGFPATLDDVAAGLDALAGLDVPTTAVVTVGHSAGGHLAVWATTRPHAQVEVTAAVSQAGVLDLAGGHAAGLGSGAIDDFLGGPPSSENACADPTQLVPAPAPVLCVHGRRDDVVPLEQSTRYVEAATAAGGRARLVATDGDHFTLIDPDSTDWAVVVEAVPTLLS